jgi:hypothetical protein
MKALAKSLDRRYATPDRLPGPSYRAAHDQGSLVELRHVTRSVRDLFPEAAAEGAAFS